MDEQLRAIDRLPKPQRFCIPRRRTTRFRWLLALVGLMVVFVIGSIGMYLALLTPVDAQSQQHIRIVVAKGDSAATIARTLKKSGLIRSAEAFGLYTQLSGTKSKLQAGGYLLKKSQSVSDIVAHLVAGKSDEMSVTILPGLTLAELADPEVKGSLADQGFTPAEIRAAYARSYQSPLLSDRPRGADLEGYLFPETYRVSADASLETVFDMALGEFYRQLQQNNIQAGLAAQNLTLYQGVTLASIVQKEVSREADQRQVAQVFLKRLRDKMVLGSDVTFLYIAKKEGRTPSVNDPSPYNTRRQGGLPPGPIANFHLSALLAVVNPAPGDYVYFVAGDDGVTYFARTEAEHNANVATHCKTLCQ